MKIRCQRCSEVATLHITEVEESGYRELHLCYKCAQSHLAEPVDGAEPGDASDEEGSEEPEPVVRKACPVCRMTFQEFRRTGRLGCSNDFELFREELRPLLENVHGPFGEGRREELKHSGKSPKRHPRDARIQQELLQCRQQLQAAVIREDYEKAAELRDQIERLERAR